MFEYDLVIEQARKTGKLTAMVELLLRELQKVDPESRTARFVEKEFKEVNS